jgi:hypothetical protein
MGPTLPSCSAALMSARRAVTALAEASIRRSALPGLFANPMTATQAKRPAGTSVAESPMAADLGFFVERVTRIELALSAWEVERSWPLAALTCHF